VIGKVFGRNKGRIVARSKDGAVDCECFGTENVIVMTVTLDDDVGQLSARVERLSCVIVHVDGLDERAQIFESDIGIVCFSTTSCVEKEDRLGGGHDLGIDKGMFCPNVIPLFDEKCAWGQLSSCECREMCCCWYSSRSWSLVFS